MKKKNKDEELIFETETFFTVKMKDKTEFNFYFSYGVKRMEQLLKENNIPFKMENYLIGEKYFNWEEGK